jgi:serine/threonine protein kinase
VLKYKAIPFDAIRSTLARADTLQLEPSSPSAPRSDQPSGPRYERVRELGEGGMGRVDQARDCDLLRDVAVKLLRPELAGDVAMLDQFLWEARVTAHLDHPNIVPVHDVGRFDDGVFFTMKLIRGATLEATLAAVHDEAAAARAQMPRNRRLRLFLQLCNAVAFAHARGVLHRDLKPSNVMVGEFGELLVTDWGLALPLETEAGRQMAMLMPASLATLSAGTPAYMSPEQARGDKLDERSDVYSLGVILYELAGLSPAFEGSSAPVVLTKVLGGQVRRLQDVDPSLSPSLVAVVTKAMALDAADRYASVAELADEVEAVIDGGSPAAEHASMIRRAARFYVGHDPALGKLRVVDLDVMVLCGLLLGVGSTGVALEGARTWWGWACVVASFVASVPTLVRWIRARADRRRGSRR